ncbi:MAG: shikimate kinase [Porticoccaceae bacterium]|nr:shikimate kinase [Porticoccaceae bacterium]
MGAGKTTVGRQLAKLLRLTFFDLDAEIEARSGADIPWIFDVEGEAGFRKRETAMLTELASKNNVVIATGGGVVLDPGNRVLMSSSGLVVYFVVPRETLYERTLRDTKRPLLQVADRRAVIDKLLAEREPLYREVAELVYEGVNNSPVATAEELARLIQAS